MVEPEYNLLPAGASQQRKRKFIGKKKLNSDSPNLVLSNNPLVIDSLSSVIKNIFSSSKVSCDQNTGPFPTVAQPTISKADVQKQLITFYNQCLKTEYTQGYLPQSVNQNSESEAYALYQAFLANDKLTFARVLNWSNQNIKRPNDTLLAWKFSVTKKPIWQKPYFQTDKVNIIDSNSATDADTDFAYALLMAGQAWHNQTYIDKSKSMINDIWNEETAEVSGKRYVIAGNWANQSNYLAVDPSYISPQAYRAFAVVDSSHDWNSLIADSYDFLTKVSDHGSAQPFLPPDWVQVNKPDASLTAYPNKSNSQDYTYDAFRTFWRVGLDQLKSQNQESWNYVSSSTEFATDWQKNQQMCALYHLQNGNYVCDTSTTSTLAAPIGIFSVTNGYLASQVIQKYYLKGNILEFPDTDFYAKSWHWFATWLWTKS